MENLRDEADRRWLVGILLGEFYRQLEGTVFEGRVMWAEDHSVPYHDVVVSGRARDSSGGILLKSVNKREATVNTRLELTKRRKCCTEKTKDCKVICTYNRQMCEFR